MLEPEYAKAAGELESNADVKLVKVDATQHGDLAQEFGVGGYPTLKFFKNGNKEALEYGGGRSAPEIVSWIEKKSGPAVLEVNGADAAKEATENNAVIVVAFRFFNEFPYKNIDDAFFVKKNCPLIFFSNDDLYIFYDNFIYINSSHHIICNHMRSLEIGSLAFAFLLNWQILNQRSGIPKCKITKFLL